MICSDLAISVFDQTNLLRDTYHAWWVELALQSMKINGLVKMINGSRSLDIEYIEGYIPKYKWALRKDVLPIHNHGWFFEYIQGINIPCFSWGAWSKIVSLDISDIEYVEKGIYAANAQGVTDLNYILKVAMGIKQQQLQNHEIQQAKLNQSKITVEQAFHSAIDNKTKQMWKEVRNLI